MKKYLFLVLFFSTYVNSFELCERLATESGKMKIPKSCRDFIIEKNQDTHMTRNKYAQVYGFRNNLFINLVDSNKKNTIAGDMTLLHDIQSVKINDKSLFILNKNSKDKSELLVFNLYNHGNIAPKQVIEIDRKNCEEINYLGNENNFYIKCENELVYGKLQGDSRYTLENKKPHPFKYRKLQKMGLSDKIKMATYQEQLLVLDLKNDMLYSFTQTNDFEKQWEINLRSEGLKRAPASIEIENEGFSVKDIEGEKLFYK